MGRTATSPQPHPLNSAPPAARRLLKDRAYEVIKQWIVSGQAPPGTFLSERQLVTQLGMSKTPIRTALERLDSEGLVTVWPQQGVIVRELSVHEVVDLFEIRQALERHVVCRLAQHVPAKLPRELNSQLKSQALAAKAGNVERSVELDLDFHLTLCRYVGNQEILRVMHHLRDKFIRIVTSVLGENSSRLVTNYQEHAAVAEAILAGDADRASHLMHLHLKYGERFLLSKGRS